MNEAEKWLIDNNYHNRYIELNDIYPSDLMTKFAQELEQENKALRELVRESFEEGLMNDDTVALSVGSKGLDVYWKDSYSFKELNEIGG